MYHCPVRDGVTHGAPGLLARGRRRLGPHPSP
jgi:hypothetical protein